MVLFLSAIKCQYHCLFFFHDEMHRQVEYVVVEIGSHCLDPSGSNISCLYVFLQLLENVEHGVGFRCARERVYNQSKQQAMTGYLYSYFLLCTCLSVYVFHFERNLASYAHDLCEAFCSAYQFVSLFEKINVYLK